MLNFFSSLSLLNLLDPILFLKAIQPQVPRYLGTHGICAPDLLEPNQGYLGTWHPPWYRGTQGHLDLSSITHYHYNAQQLCNNAPFLSSATHRTIMHLSHPAQSVPAQERFARENHCEIERRRRNKMSAYITELSDMVSMRMVMVVMMMVVMVMVVVLMIMVEEQDVRLHHRALRHGPHLQRPCQKTRQADHP